MCDPHRYPEFVDTTQRMVDVPDEEFGVGYTYKEFGGIRPFFGESTWKVVEFNPPWRQVQSGDDGTMTVELFVELERITSGTRLTHSVELHPRWYMAPLNAIMRVMTAPRRCQQPETGETPGLGRVYARDRYTP